MAEQKSISVFDLCASFRTPEGPSTHTWRTLCHWSDWWYLRVARHQDTLIPPSYQQDGNLNFCNLDPSPTLPRYLAGLLMDSGV